MWTLNSGQNKLLWPYETLFSFLWRDTTTRPSSIVSSRTWWFKEAILQAQVMVFFLFRVLFSCLPIFFINSVLYRFIILYIQLYYDILTFWWSFSIDLFFSRWRIYLWRGLQRRVQHSIKVHPSWFASHGQLEFSKYKWKSIFHYIR